MKRNQLFTLFGLFLLLFACSKEEINTPAYQAQLSQQELDDIILQQLEATGKFKWTASNNAIISSALIYSDSVAFVGYKPANESNIKDKIHLIDITDQAWQDARQLVLNTIIEETNKAYPSLKVTEEDVLLDKEQDGFPTLTVRIYNKAIIDALRKMPELRYIEPGSYQMADVSFRSDAGCGGSVPSYVTPADYTTISPYVRVPWNYDFMNIQAAWNTTSGDGVTVCLIDTGTSPSQSKLGSQFNYGQSQGRFIDRQGTYVSSWWWWSSPDGPDDQCGHGTSMAGIIAAPRGYDGTSVGVAYNSDLLAIRGTGDVWINGWQEKKGVKKALKIAGDRGDVKVISMSIGDIFWSNTVADGIYYAYNRDKMMIAAAGTSTWFTSWAGVIFPAYMSETVAVTGIKDGTPMTRCDVCHSGSEVDFIAVMQRQNDNSRTTLTLPMSGNQLDRVGGSSAATATTAGIAALIWSTNPNQSRAQVYQRMKNAAAFYPSRDSEFGWGVIDAGYAVTHW